MSLRDIWFDSEGFQRYRGTGWMKEPCASCEHKERDLGGCRCQAWLLAHDARAADPVCHLSPHHALVADAVAQASANPVTEHPLVFRDVPNSNRLSRAAAPASSD